MAGIICIETEWQITQKRNRRNLDSEPLLQFISQTYGVGYIYRRVATIQELAYYLKQFRKAEYNKYNVLYLSFHGDTHAISLEGEKEVLTLDQLSDLGGSIFADRLIHFSSCRTLLGSRQTIEKFKQSTGARHVSGYRKSVPTDLSAVHDIAGQ